MLILQSISIENLVQTKMTEAIDNQQNIDVHRTSTDDGMIIVIKPDFENFDFSIRINREFDSNESDYSDLQFEKYDLPRIWTDDLQRTFTNDGTISPLKLEWQKANSSVRDNWEDDVNENDWSDWQSAKHDLQRTSTDDGRIMFCKPDPENADFSIRANLKHDSKEIAGRKW
jgi:hypothetical protein